MWVRIYCISFLHFTRAPFFFAAFSTPTLAFGFA
jgi:hypothetical protein